MSIVVVGTVGREGFYREGKHIMAGKHYGRTKIEFTPVDVVTIYQRVQVAYQEGRGLHLSADEVAALWEVDEKVREVVDGTGRVPGEGPL